MNVEQLLTLEQAAAILTVSVDSVYRLVESGQLAHVDVATRAYKNNNRPTPKTNRKALTFRADDLQAFILARRVPATRGPVTEAPVPADPIAPAAPHVTRPPRPMLNLPGADRYVQ